MVRVIAAATAALCAGAGCAALVAGCGSGGTRTVVESGPPASAALATQPPATTGTAPTTGTTSTSLAGGTEAPATTRSSPEPAFTEHGGSSEGVAAAAAAVRAHGYTPNDTSEYRAGQTLHVLVGTRTGSGDGYGQQAFFFVNGRYIGTDAKEPSASVKVVSQGDTEVALAYPLYRSSDPLCCPGGGQAIVHFQLNNGRLQPLQEIPPASSKHSLSRY
jgi:hypothetical protein